jgi:tetratricopeptide (TPR) repeat protein
MTKRLLISLFLLGFAAAGFGQTQPNSRAEAYYHFSKGRSLGDQGQMNGAIEEYKKALELDPDNSMIYSEMAEMYLKNNRIREAVDTAERAIKADPDNLEAHRLLSSVYVQIIGRANVQQPPSVDTINNAIREFEEIVRIDPSERQAFLMLGRLYQVKGDRTKAAEIYKAYLGIEPGSEEGATALAKLQMDAGNNKEAAELLEEFVKQQPESSAAFQTLGQAYSDLREFEKAAAAYRRASELDPDDLELKKSEAQALFFADKIDEAAQQYQELVANEPEDGLSLLRLGQIYRRQMKYDAAREHLKKAEQFFPDSLEVQFNVMLLDRDQGFLDDALRRSADILKKSEKPDGRYTDSEKQNRRVFLTHQGLLYSTLGKYDEAIRSFTELKSLASDDNDGSVDALIIDTYRNAKNIDKAFQYSEQALKDAPDNRQLQMLHADLMAEKGRVDDSIKALQQIAKGSEDLDILSMMASIYQRARKFAEAQAVLDKAIQRFPQEPHVFFLLGALYEKQKKFSDAEGAFRKALQLNEDDAAVLNYLGFILADRGLKLEEAVKLTQKAVESDPVNGAYLDSLGWAYFKLNKLDLAEQYLKKAAIFSSTDPAIHDHLGDLYFKTRRFDEARTEWTKSLQLATDQDEANKVKKKLDDLKTSRAANK